MAMSQHFNYEILFFFLTKKQKPVYERPADTVIISEIQKISMRMCFLKIQYTLNMK